MGGPLGEPGFCIFCSTVLRRGALLFSKVICQILRSHGSKYRRFRPKLGVSGLKLQFELNDGYEMMHKAWSHLEEVPYFFSRSSVKFQGHTGQKIANFDPNWGFPDCNSSLKSLMDSKMMHKAWCLMWYRWVALLFFKVIHQISRSQETKKKSPILTRIGCFWIVTPVWIHGWLWNDAQSLT